MAVRDSSRELSTSDATRDLRFGELAASIGLFLLSTRFGFVAAAEDRALDFFCLIALFGRSGSGTPLRTHPMRCIAEQNSYVSQQH